MSKILKDEPNIKTIIIDLDWHSIYRIPNKFVSFFMDYINPVLEDLKDEGLIWLRIKDNSVMLNSDHHKQGSLVGMDSLIVQELKKIGLYYLAENVIIDSNTSSHSNCDRPVMCHSRMFMISKSLKYFYNAREVMEWKNPYSHPNDSDIKYEDISRYKVNRRSVFFATRDALASEMLTDSVLEYCIKASTVEGDLVVGITNRKSIIESVALRMGRRYKGYKVSKD